MRKIGSYGDIEKQNEQFGVLSGLCGAAKNKEEAEALLQTILTSSEKAAISQRLAILRMIYKDFKYSDIETRLKVSPSTIAKAIDGYLKNGQLNKSFNEQLGRYKFDKKEKTKIDFPNRGKIEPITGGVRQLLRQEKHFKKDRAHT